MGHDHLVRSLGCFERAVNDQSSHNVSTFMWDNCLHVGHFRSIGKQVGPFGQNSGCFEANLGQPLLVGHRPCKSCKMSKLLDNEKQAILSLRSPQISKNYHRNYFLNVTKTNILLKYRGTGLSHQLTLREGWNN